MKNPAINHKYWAEKGRFRKGHKMNLTHRFMSPIEYAALIDKEKKEKKMQHEDS